MAYMAYLIVITARASPKIWDPYDILGVSRVSSQPNLVVFKFSPHTDSLSSERQRKGDYQTLQASLTSLPPRQDPS